jgi:hypothetical protein
MNEKGLYLFFPTDPDNIAVSADEVKQLLMNQIKNNIIGTIWHPIYEKYMELLKKQEANAILQSTARKEDNYD